MPSMLSPSLNPLVHGIWGTEGLPHPMNLAHLHPSRGLALLNLVDGSL